MLGTRERRLLGLRWSSPDWRSLERREGFGRFAESFLASPYRMIVVAPDFANFDPRFNQTFAYLSLSAFTAARSPAAEREFLRRCIDRIGPGNVEPGERAEVLHLEGTWIGERRGGVGIEWLAPFDVIERSGKVVSRRTSLEAVLPALRRGIAPDEGGLYTPHGGDGIFHLLSV
jgi:hypothetical protein